MALIVEDGTGKSDAESYLSVADCDAYHVRFGNASWAAAVNGDKEVALRKATRYLDAVYNQRWVGERKEELQALAWPRINAWDSDGFAYDEDSLPTKLEEATALLALEALTTDLFPNVAAGNSGIVSESITAGPVSSSRTWSGEKPTRKRFSTVEAMLRGLIQSGNRLERA